VVGQTLGGGVDLESAVLETVEAAVARPDPEGAFVVLVKGEDDVVGETGLLRVAPPSPVLPAAQTARRRRPDRALTVLEYGADLVVGQAVLGGVDHEALAEAAQPAAVHADPEAAFCVLGQRAHGLAAAPVL